MRVNLSVAIVAMVENHHVKSTPNMKQTPLLDTCPIPDKSPKEKVLILTNMVFLVIYVHINPIPSL